MNKTLIVILALTSIALVRISDFSHSSEQQSFAKFKEVYQKIYTKEGEEQYRRHIFLKNLKAIQEHNADQKSTYLQGINQFTDLTSKQFAARYLTLRANIKQDVSAPQEITKLRVNIDWYAAGKVNPVRDQGQCGASWAFSAVGAIESLYMIEKKVKSIGLSKQEMLDCTSEYGNYGCFGGGLMTNTFRYVNEHGIHEESNYPYVGKDQACQNVTGKKWELGSFVGDDNGCSYLMEGLIRGPVSVGVDASNFYTYKSGIFDNCGNLPNSGSLVVGVTDTYWLLKESFGTQFGENGFIRIAPGNTCGVCQMISYPLLLI